MEWMHREIPRDVLDGMSHRENCLMAVLQTERFFVQDYCVDCYVVAVPTVGPTSVHMRDNEIPIPVGTFYLINPNEEFRPPDTGVADGLYLITGEQGVLRGTYAGLYGEDPAS